MLIFFMYNTLFCSFGLESLGMITFSAARSIFKFTFMPWLKNNLQVADSTVKDLADQKPDLHLALLFCLSNIFFFIFFILKRFPLAKVIVSRRQIFAYKMPAMLLAHTNPPLLRLLLASSQWFQNEQLCQGVPHGSLQLWQHKSCLAPGLWVELTSQESGAASDSSNGITQGHFVLHSNCRAGTVKHAKCHSRPGKQKVRGVVGVRATVRSLQTPPPLTPPPFSRPRARRTQQL